MSLTTSSLVGDFYDKSEGPVDGTDLALLTNHLAF